MTFGSLMLTASVIGNAYYQKKQFYPSVVYITKSNPSMAVIYVQAFVMVVLTGKLMRKIFFGQLRAAELEHLIERSWYAVTETCLAFTVFRDDFSPKFVGLFTLLLFLKCFHWLAEDRVDYMERSPVISWLFHCRVLSLLLFLGSLDIHFVNLAYYSTLTKGASVQLVFGFEYAILMTVIVNIFIKYVLHTIDLHSETPWENKAVYLLHTELVMGFIKGVLYVTFMVIMIKIHTFPLFAIRPMYLTIRAFKKALNDVIMSRRAIRNMNTLYPDATPEELASADNVCIICREEMTTSSKKLPCNHIFHASCLRSWFQRQQTCPTCRMDVLRPPGTEQPQQHAAVPQPQLQMPNQPPPGLFPGFYPGAFPFWPPLQQPPVPVPPPPSQAGAAASQPGTSAAAPPPTSTTGQAASSTMPPPGAPSGFPFLMPPFPFMPFTVPPPLPPVNFTGLSNEEVHAMEGQERQHVEARIQCLRNIQTLLDAAVVQMQQYSAIVAAMRPYPEAGVPQAAGESQPPAPSTSGGTEPESQYKPEPGPSSAGAEAAQASESEETPASQPSDFDAENYQHKPLDEREALRRRRLHKFVEGATKSQTPDDSAK